MSRHYLVMRQSVLQGQDQGVDEILRKLSATRPELAKRLMSVDWEPVIKHVAREALEQAAKSCGCEVAEEYENKTSYGSGGVELAEGWECVGVLRLRDNPYGSDMHIQLGIAITGTKLSLFSNGWSVETPPYQIMKAAFEKAYKEQALKAAMQLIGGDVKREEHAGVVVLQTVLKGGSK